MAARRKRPTSGESGRTRNGKSSGCRRANKAATASPAKKRVRCSATSAGKKPRAASMNLMNAGTIRLTSAGRRSVNSSVVKRSSMTQITQLFKITSSKIIHPRFLREVRPDGTWGLEHQTSYRVKDRGDYQSAAEVIQDIAFSTKPDGGMV